MTSFKTIKKLKTAGKWMEVWFSDSERWEQCCKQYMLYEVVNKADLDHYILNHGFVGLEVEWPDSSDKPLSIRKPDAE